MLHNLHPTSGSSQTGGFGQEVWAFALKVHKYIGHLDAFFAKMCSLSLALPALSTSLTWGHNLESVGTLDKSPHPDADSAGI